METYEEEFVSGFCKAQNQTRMVICEYACSEDGGRTFLESDCAYGVCPHTSDCLLMAEALKTCLPSSIE